MNWMIPVERTSSLSKTEREKLSEDYVVKGWVNPNGCFYPKKTLDYMWVLRERVSEFNELRNLTRIDLPA